MRLITSALVFLITGIRAAAQDVGMTSLKVEVNLVALNVTVTDKTGRPYAALRSDNFRIFDNGVEQVIHHFSPEDQPYSMGLVLDRSGSMAPMIEDVYRAAFHTVRASKPEDEFFIVVFNDKNENLQDFSTDRKLLEKGLQGVWAYGATALYDAILAAIEHVKQGSHDKKALLVVTDGADNSSRHGFQEALERARSEGVAVYVVGMFDEPSLPGIGLPTDSLKALLTQLAEATGGKAYFPRNVKECQQACIKIAEELRQQYTLGYYPRPKVRNGSWHSVQVQLSLPEVLYDEGLKARTRAGYYAPRAED